MEQASKLEAGLLYGVTTLKGAGVLYPVYMRKGWPVCGNTYEKEVGVLLNGRRTTAIVPNVAKTPNECFEHTYQEWMINI